MSGLPRGGEHAETGCFQFGDAGWLLCGHEGRHELGSIVSQLAQEGVIDEYQVVVIPVVLGKGRTMFEGVTNRLSMKLMRSRAFGNGNVYLCYEPKT